MKKLFFGILTVLSISNIFCITDTEIINDCDSLLYACQVNHLDNVLFLLHKGVDVNCSNKVGNTPLGVACSNGHLSVVKVLLENKANVNIGNESGVTPLYKASRKGYFKIVKELLKVKDININARDKDGVTPLFCASNEGYQDIVGELLKSDAIKVNSVTYRGEGPLDVASTEEIKKALIQKGAIAFKPIIKKLEQFVAGVNKGDSGKLDSVISEHNKILKSEIRLLVKDGFFYSFDFRPICKNVEFIDANKVKITGIFNARGRTGFVTWKLKGMSNYFVFEKSNNEWFIIDTDFTQKLSSTNFRLIFIGIFACLFFWIWMLVDCFNRKFDTRGRWFIFLFIFNIIAAILYFFIIKLKNVKS